jgi:phytoene dehydrogenase-like protein
MIPKVPERNKPEKGFRVILAPMENHKLIVIGGGISGLSTAIAWLKNLDGPVLVLEKEPMPGGCVTTFARGGYQFDTVQLIPGMDDLLGYLGIRLPMTRYRGTLSRLFLADPPSSRLKRFAIPADTDQFEAGLAEAYPADIKNLARFFATCRAMVAELSHLTLEPTPGDILRILVKCPNIIKTSGDTWKRYLGRFRFKSPELVEILDLFSSYSGLSGDRCAALLTVSAMTTSLEGSGRPDTGFIKLPDAMRKRVRELGGEVRTGCRVTRLLFDGNAVRGVGLSDGSELTAETVVSTIDTGVFLGNLIGPGRLDKAGGAYRKAGRNLLLSPSMLAINLGLDGNLDLKGMGLDGAYNLLTTGRPAHERAYSLWDKRLQDRDTGSFHFAFYSPSLYNGSDKQTLVIHATPVTAEPWMTLRDGDPEKYAAAKKEAADHYVALLEKWVIPDLSKHIVLTDVSTPATVGRFLGSPGGSCYDMMPVLSQFGLKRLPLRTPFKGLYHTKFSHGIWPAMHAGLQVIDLITGGSVMNRGARYQAPPA